MDFSWPQEYLDFKQSVAAFAAAELNEHLLERDRGGSFSMELWKRCADQGIQGLSIPNQYGGATDEVNLSRSMLASL